MTITLYIAIISGTTYIYIYKYYPKVVNETGLLILTNNSYE